MNLELSDVYIMNPDIAYINKNDTIKIIFLDESINELIELHGPAAKCFSWFEKNTSSLEAIKHKLRDKSSAQSFDQDFDKLIGFFLTKSLIKKL